MKISIIGSGNVGATLAMRTLESGLGDVVLVDIVEGLPQGKALDISDAGPIMGYENKIIGTNDFQDIKNSDIVVITAGLARKPGMSREDLIQKNALIIKDVVLKIKGLCRDPIVIVVTNPLDVMAYYVYKIGDFDKNKVIGMAGTLDSARFRNLIAKELNVPHTKIQTLVLGCHGDAMVPVVSSTSVDKRPLTDIIGQEKIDQLVRRTQKRGAEIVARLKTGSAYYSPSAGVLQILNAIKTDSQNVLCVSTLLQGEYGVEGCFLGVPAKIGENGVREIVKIELTDEELKALHLSAEKTRRALSLLPDR